MTEADSTKQVRDRKDPGDTGLKGRKPLYSKSGAWPKRMRGYYRGVKRKEEWALYLQDLFKRAPLQALMTWVYHDKLGEESFFKNLVYKENPWLSLIEKDEMAFSGKYFPIPLKFNDKD